MNYKEIVTDLKNKIYKPIYLLSGEEPYYIDKITELIEKNVLTEAEKAFNLMIFYGKDSDVRNIIHTANRFPMMANQQVVIIKEAQSLADIDQLQFYAEKPLKSTLLVICYKHKKFDERKKLYKAIAIHGVVFDSKKLYEDKIPAWIEEYLKEARCTITPEASLLLVDYLGNDLSKIANELNKLIITAGEKSQITPALIEKNIGISKEFSTFELNNAIGLKNIVKANRIVNYLGKNQKSNPYVLTISSMYSFFSKLLIYHSIPDKSRNVAAAAMGINPYFLKDYVPAAKNYPPQKLRQIMSLLREYDVKSKGFGNVSADAGELLRELVFKIMH